MESHFRSKFIYEICMILFAVASVATIWVQSGVGVFITWTVWLVFFLDFSTRFFRAQDKWAFLKKNPFLLIAIIPLDSIFQLARITQIIQLFRLKTMTKYFASPLVKKIKTRRLILLVPFNLLLVFLFTIPLFHLEPAIRSYKDAFKECLFALLFFGKSALQPGTVTGNAIIVTLTILGVIMHAVIISYILAATLELRVVQIFLRKLRPKNKDM
ncbi:potassium channel 1 [Bacillus freudenreichii]|nr:potassium channel 1 [Bacillus freudenreichii]